VKGFGARLRQLREVRGLSQHELAALAGIAVMQVNRYERDIHLPSIETTIKLARLFRMTTDDLLNSKIGDLKPPDIRNVKLYDRFRVLDTLPKQDQDVVLELVDAVIARRRVTAALAGGEAAR
jgi:transcriptional regulator with XRE-family HTH domain